MTRNAWVSCQKPNPNADMRLFCFPYAGGSAVIFRDWVSLLPGRIELCAIELPGRGTRFREQAFTSLSALIEAVAFAILPYLDRSFVFFGHSFGGLLSFELTRYLRRTARAMPTQLLISGRRAPQLPLTKPKIHNLPDLELIQELRRLNGTPEVILQNADLMELLLPVIRADFTVLETYVYQPEPPLNCPISVFGGLKDPEVSEEELRAWKVQTESSFTLDLLPGEHFFVHTEQQMLLELIMDKLS